MVAERERERERESACGCVVITYLYIFQTFINLFWSSSVTYTFYNLNLIIYAMKEFQQDGTKQDRNEEQKLAIAQWGIEN